MAEPKWYTKQGPDGKWYKTQAASPEEATAKFSRIAAPGQSSTATAAEQPSFGDTLSREVSSLGSSVASLPSAIYHSAADPETPEEVQRFGKGFEARIGPTGRLIDRMAAQPVMNAADWYSKLLRGKIPDAAGQALSVAPEAMGIGASGPLSGKLAEKIASGAVKLATPDPNAATKAGPLYGALSRAQAMMDRLDTAAKGISVNYRPAYEWAKKAIALEPHGFTVPKPIKDFVAWVDTQSKPGADALGGKNFVDRPGSMNPLPFQVARNFEKSLGAKIPWDQDAGGVMNGFMKKMRESLGQETATALKPYGLDVPYLRAKADFTKAYGARDKFGPIGYVGGKLAGYGAGSVAGHPFMLGYAGGKMGQSAAGSIVDSVINAGRDK